MRGSNLQTMTGDADSLYQALIFGLDGSIDCTAWTQCSIPFDGIDEVMQLPVST